MACAFVCERLFASVSLFYPSLPPPSTPPRLTSIVIPCIAILPTECTFITRSCAFLAGTPEREKEKTERKKVRNLFRSVLVNDLPRDGVY